MEESKSNYFVSSSFEKFNFLVNKYGMEKVYQSIEKLSSENREILFFYMGINCEKLSIREICEKCNRSVRNVYYHLSFSVDKVAQFLGENEKICVSHKDKITEFYDKYKDYPEEEINRAFEKMEGLGKEVILSYYGIGRECLRPVDISSKYGIGYHAVYGYLKNGLKIFERHLNDKSNGKRIVYTPEHFYFKFKAFSKEKIDEKLLCLDEMMRSVLNDFYGFSGEALEVDEIARKYNLEVDGVNTAIDKALRKINSLLKTDHKESNRKKEFFDMFKGHSEEEIYHQLEKLDERAQYMLKAYYGLDCPVFTMEAIGEKYDLTRSRVDQIIKRQIQILKKSCESEEEKKEKMRDSFYKKFGEYSKEKIEFVLSNFRSRDREIILYYYGFEKELLGINQLAEKYKLSPVSISTIIRVRTEEILNILQDSSSNKRVFVKEFYQKFEGYSEEKIDSALVSLGHYDAKIISLYYGLDGERFSTREIANRFRTNYHNIRHIVDSGIKKIKNMLENSNADESFIKKEFYDSFKGFPVKLINRAMWGLNSKDRNIIISYYGFQGNAESVNHIARKHGISEMDVLDSIKESFRIIKKGIIDLMNIEFFREVGCRDIARIKEIMKDLNENDLKLVSLCYGLNGQDIMSKLEICEKFNVTEYVVNEKISNVMGNIKSRLQGNKR